MWLSERKRDREAIKNLIYLLHRVTGSRMLARKSLELNHVDDLRSRSPTVGVVRIIISSFFGIV